MRLRPIFGCFAAAFVVPAASVIAEDRDHDRDDHGRAHTATPIKRHELDDDRG
jgi:hypothetical protein